MENKSKCPFCEKEIESGFDFCPYCGEPLTEMAKELRDKSDSIVELEFASSLIGEVKDENTLKLLKKFVEKFSK